MPWLGAHLSVAGGFYKAVHTADALGMEAVQIFTHSPTQWVVTAEASRGRSPRSGKASKWRSKPLDPQAVAAFHEARKHSKVRCFLAHDSYLINVASADPHLRRRSIEALIVEMERAEALGLFALVMHPGAGQSDEDRDAILRIAEALDEVHQRCPKNPVRILLETTAGQGSTLGHRFEHLAEILSRVRQPERLGVCFDTCHVFAAGYPLAPEKAYRETLRQFDAIVGVKRIAAFHLNDSAKPLGSRVDRHAHIGRGCLGLEPFRLLLNDPRFRKHPMLMETPKGTENGVDLDEINLHTLRTLLA
ncbi:MAG: deoxyribonuclease IV [Gemmatales bacterium]|nr:deoxyribonuclease IV [Gemmatales bacterium]MDW8386967.1 deoxyribonuclease IV [Gemmatales bacterium]